MTELIQTAVHTSHTRAQEGVGRGWKYWFPHLILPLNTATRKLTQSEKAPLGTCHYDLDLWPFDPKIYRCLPFFILHLCMMYEVSRSNHFQVIALQRSVDRRTDGQTDGRTDKVITIGLPDLRWWGPNYIPYQISIVTELIQTAVHTSHTRAQEGVGHRRKPTLYCTTLRYVYIPWATTRDFSLNSLNMRELWWPLNNQWNASLDIDISIASQPR